MQKVFGRDEEIQQISQAVVLIGGLEYGEHLHDTKTHGKEKMVKTDFECWLAEDMKSKGYLVHAVLIIKQS